MKYELETKRINDALKTYAWEIILNSPHSKAYNQDTLKMFVNAFIGDEIQFGRMQAEKYLMLHLADIKD